MALTDSEIISCVTNYRNESDEAKKPRMQLNKENFDAYHLRQDWAHKIKGQSKEFLPKVATAVEQNCNMIQQGLLDIGEWFDVDSQEGIDPDVMKIKPATVYRLLDRQLQKDGFVNKVGDSIKLGMLGGNIIARVGGKYSNKPRFVTRKQKKDGKTYTQLIVKKDKAWQLNIRLIRHEDFGVDPTGRGLYEFEDVYMDLHEVVAMSKGEDAVYDAKLVSKLTSSFDAVSDQKYKKAQETAQGLPVGGGFRRQVKISEYWGTLLNAKGEVEYENCVWTVANDLFVIQRPEQNPNWHQESPFVVASLMSVPFSMWPKAMMDAPTRLNFAANEIFNLLLDSGIVSVHGIKQLRVDWLDDVTQVSNGINPGDTLKVNSACPPGAKVLESVFTGEQPSEAMNMLNVVNQEGASGMFTNELRSGGGDMKNIRATAVVENSQALNNMSSGMIKNIEGDEGSGFITRVLAKSWKTIAQNMSDLDSKEVEAILGKDLTAKLLGMGKEEIFAETVQSCKFKAFGVSAVMNKMKEFTKLQAMLQTVFQNPALTEAFMKKYSIEKMLTEIMRSLDIKTFKIEVDEKEGGELTNDKKPVSNGLPDMQSQTPQAGAASNQQDVNPMASSQPASPQAL